MVAITMGRIHSYEELMNHSANMNSENSVIQLSIPGKGKFTLALQEDDEKSIKVEAKENLELKRMLKESMEQYGDGRGVTTKELLKSLSKRILHN